MDSNSARNWQRFQKYYLDLPALEMALDVSTLPFDDQFLRTLEPHLVRAFSEMDALERGAKANPDEDRMVGHYWLRDAQRAPTPQLQTEIVATVQDIISFSQQVHSENISGQRGPFQNLLVIGIGGSALGPQFVGEALSDLATDKLRSYFLDNTDPDGMDRVLAVLRPQLGQTLTVVISKSGGTKETRNGMLEVKAAYTREQLNFEAHAIAITGEGSQLAATATADGWLRRFPMWDWVGGRTSELSAVGLLPAALQGFAVEELLAGARIMDDLTRVPITLKNPAALLAAAWFLAGNGKGTKNMVVLPYKDRLQLFSKYLQQLVMESLGKEKDRSSLTVHQGLTVYGNKGSTDQHAYVQQLRDGPADFFVTFIEVLRDRRGDSEEIEPGIRAGDYLHGFLHGTKHALSESGRNSLTLTLKDVSARSVGALIALYERAVGLYASLINVNAYHQPGVEAGKKAATAIINLQLKLTNALANETRPLTAAQAALAAETTDIVSVFYLLEHLAANPDRGIDKTPGATPFDSLYRKR